MKFDRYLQLHRQRVIWLCDLMSELRLTSRYIYTFGENEGEVEWVNKKPNNFAKFGLNLPWDNRWPK